MTGTDRRTASVSPPSEGEARAWLEQVAEHWAAGRRTSAYPPWWNAVEDVWVAYGGPLPSGPGREQVRRSSWVSFHARLVDGREIAVQKRPLLTEEHTATG
ncbi:hypothetical protein ETD86_29445 [Nonomuraea turkmeniaca]|uniref:Uncharacterized protein n=1 Tax=Nonomuraea turkmeniaca TaxID=103838 RepID=A0A5S4F9X8_9ACTN|nr:hypothetical protein [Nonomuraea turkmeniaca]TMR14073.1 hypothetical protein ETD86_29445 [Nonomuraea turkmeniaca]